MNEQANNYGIVYVLTNTAMPGLVKIGMTTRSEVETRMRELYSTGVPVPFECYHACKVDANDCKKVEKALHVAFYPNRVNPNREFFKLDPEQAKAILMLLDKTSDITNEVAAELNNDSTDTDKAAAEKLKRSRRPPLNFHEMDIPIGSKLEFTLSSDIIVEVCSDKRVMWNGEERSLSSIVKEYLQSEYYVQPTPYWIYNGKSLQDIYNETYTVEDE